jgi:hypothetical protein
MYGLPPLVLYPVLPFCSDSAPFGSEAQTQGYDGSTGGADCGSDIHP